MRSLFTRRVVHARIGVLAAAAALVAGVLVPTAAAAAAPSPAPIPAKHHHTIGMGTYKSSSYAAQAAHLPKGLGTALKRDLNKTPAEYLAEAAATVQAVKVIASLKSAGVHVLGSKMHGTSLTVNVASAADKAAVTAAGATAVVGKPVVPDFSHTIFKSVVATTPTYGGEAWFGQTAQEISDGDGEGFRCSIGFSGYSASAAQFATAGHCAVPLSGNAYLLTQNAPTDNGGTLNFSGPALGATVAGEAEFGSNMDYGIVGEGASVIPQASLYTWGGSNGAPLASAALPIVGQTAAVAGANLCKSGATSGWTCGVITDVDATTQVYGDDGLPNDVNTIVATTCLLPGDSGGGAVIGQNAAGIDSGGEFTVDDPTSCSQSKKSVFFPMVSTKADSPADGKTQSVTGQVGSNWKLLAAPVVTSPAAGAAVTPGSPMTGTLFNPQSNAQISLYFDGSSSAFAQVSGASGSWSIPLTGLPDGKHTYSVSETLAGNQVAVVTGSLVVPVPVAVRGGVGDFNGDGNSDVIVRDGNGTAFLYPGNGGTGFLTRVQLTTVGAWANMTAIVAAGDLTGDGRPDIVTRDQAGTLWLYPNNGSNGFAARIQLGATSAFAGMTAIQGVGDFNGDGHADLVARTSSGNVLLYPGNGTPTNTLGAPVTIATGWGTFTGIMGIGDFDGDGKSDILARDSAGALWLYPGLGSGTSAGNGFSPRVQVGGGWQGITIQAIGDFNNDGHEDIFVRDANGALFLYPGTGNTSSPFLARIQVGGGWQGLTIAGDAASLSTVPLPVPAAVSGGVGDFNGDGNSDVVVRDGNGTLFLYPGNGGTGFLARVQLTAVGAWAGMTAIVAGGDLNGDGNPDIVARDHGGTLWLYPGRGTATNGYTGAGTGGFGTPEQLGATGAFMGITAIQGVGDLNGDGHADLIARDTSGNLLLYPGNGTGTNTLGASSTLATGWGTFTGIMGIGDFDGDGKSDVLARDSAGALWLYPGLGTGTGTGASPAPGFAPRIQVGGGWQGITIQAIGDFNNDGHEDIFVRDANGALFLYPGTGIANNPFLARIQVGGGWQGLTIAGDASSITPIAPPVPAAVSGGIGDFNSDGNSDVVVRDGNGTLFLYPGNGGTGFLTRVQLSPTVGDWASKTAIVAAGDLNGDGHPDIVARDAHGTLTLYAGAGNQTMGGGVQLGSTSEFAAATAIQGVGDFNGDGHADLVARVGDNLLLYPGNGTPTSTLGAAPITIATGWGTFTGIMGIGDFDGDGKSDVLARDSAGALWLYPGLGSATTALTTPGTGGFGTRVQVGGGWQGITIQAIGDFNNDGHEDIFVRDANGALWLYPGTGVASSPFLARIQVGGGWQGLTIAGDAASISTVPPAP